MPTWAALMGYVIVHELGHLLLGPGHTAEGVMQTGWNESELHALRQRWLRFGKKLESRIHQVLQSQGGKGGRPEAKTIVDDVENSVAQREGLMVRRTADQMFASAGVRIPSRADTPSVTELAQERPIVVRFAAGTPASSDHPEPWHS